MDAHQIEEAFAVTQVHSSVLSGAEITIKITTVIAIAAINTTIHGSPGYPFRRVGFHAVSGRGDQ
ncbi:hypothetical protein [Streptomyces yunnanensis]|uniref:hypothetical protein n=1 Tax=Streptomyces yunnanensis TaxID=156453 RepID=UPI00257088A2|nr:hypothetical protein [Streptomyces yunnanensis]